MVLCGMVAWWVAPLPHCVKGIDQGRSSAVVQRVQWYHRWSITICKKSISNKCEFMCILFIIIILFYIIIFFIYYPYWLTHSSFILRLSKYSTYKAETGFRHSLSSLWKDNLLLTSNHQMQHSTRIMSGSPKMGYEQQLIMKGYFVPIMQ